MTIGEDGYVAERTIRRVSVVGNAGAGKSSMAVRIGLALGVPCIELDSIHHLPGWQAIEPELFLGKITEITAGDGWVIDGNYRTVVVDGPIWLRADTVVWLDLPRRQVMRQVTMRTVRRIALRQELWNGNREPWSNVLSWNPQTSIIRWAWTQHAKYQQRYSSAMHDERWAHIEFVRLTSHAAADRWLATLVT